MDAALEAVRAALRGEAAPAQAALLRRLLRRRFGVALRGDAAPRAAALAACFCLAARARDRGFFDGLDCPRAEPGAGGAADDDAADDCVGEDDQRHGEPSPAARGRQTSSAELRALGEARERLRRALDAIDRLSRRYVALAGRLGAHGNEVTPLDAYLHGVQRRDTASALRERIRAVQEERALYEDLAGQLAAAEEEEEEEEVVNDSGHERVASSAESDLGTPAHVKTKLAGLQKAVEGLESELMESAQAVENVRAQWTAAKARVPAQTLKRITSSTKMRAQAKQITRGFPPSVLQGEDPGAAARRAELEALCAATIARVRGTSVRLV